MLFFNNLNILFVKSKSHGVVLVLDGMIQCTEFDEYSYQEMISFLPLFSHPKPQRVGILTIDQICVQSLYLFYNNRKH